MVSLNRMQIRSFLRWSYDKGVTIRDYYHYLAQNNIIPRAYYKGYNQRLMICPLHDDSSPSMGTLTDTDGTELFHCFGCGKAGTVLDLAKDVLSLHETQSDILELVLRSLGKDPDSMILSWSSASAESSGVQREPARETVSYGDVIDMLKQPGKTILSATTLLERAYIDTVYFIPDE